MTAVAPVNAADSGPARLEKNPAPGASNPADKIATFMATMAKKQYENENERIFYEELMPHLDGVLTFAYHLCQSEAESQDLAQETMTRAWANIHHYLPGSNAKAWLFTICRNQFINNYRKKKVRGNQVNFEDFAINHANSKNPNQNPHLRQDIHAAMMGDEITMAVQRLTPANRMVLILSFVEDFSYEEIAAIADIPIGTVRSRLHRARNSMKRDLQKYATGLGYETDPTGKPNGSGTEKPD